MLPFGTSCTVQKPYLSHWELQKIPVRGACVGQAGCHYRWQPARSRVRVCTNCASIRMVTEPTSPGDRNRGRKCHLIKYLWLLRMTLWVFLVWLWIKPRACFARGIPHMRNDVRLSWPVLFVVVVVNSHYFVSFFEKILGKHVLKKNLTMYFQNV
jgi:hypothetical protein